MTQRAVTTPLALAVTAPEQHDGQLVESRIDETVESAIRQAAKKLTSNLEMTLDECTSLLMSALDDEQLASDRTLVTNGDEPTASDTDSIDNDTEPAINNDDREHLTAAIQRAVDGAVDEELSLSVDDCERLATAFLRILQRRLCGNTDDGVVDSPIQLLGDSALQEGQFDAAESYYQLGLECARSVDDTLAEAAALRSLGNVALQRDDLETAETYHRDSLEIARKIDQQSVKADSLASLGTIEASRGYPETAETYLSESLDLKRLLDDRLGEATCLGSLGNVAESCGDYETAVDRYTAALELFSVDEPRERLQTLQGLIDAERALGDETAASQHCQQGIELLETVKLSDQAAYSHWFESTHAQLTGDRETIVDLYTTALSHLRDDDLQVAFELLEGLWEARHAADSEAYELCLRAGVGFAGAHLLVTDDALETSRESVVRELNEHRTQLSEPASALLAFVSTGREATQIETTGLDEASEAVDDIERLAYAAFLDALASTPPPATLYSKALSGIALDNRGVERVIRLSVAAWNKRDEVDDPRSTVGAGLIAQAHRDLFDVELPVDRETVFDAAANAEGLPEPLQALFERLETGSTEWPKEPISSPTEDGALSLSKAEQLAVERILARLDE